MRQFVQEEVTELTGKGTVGNDYLFEAFFIPFFSKTLLKPLVREVAEESIQGIYIGEVIEDMVTAEAAWVHAYLHRVEGAEGNAEYWYNRAVQPVCVTSLDAEWKALHAEFEGLDRC